MPETEASIERAAAGPGGSCLQLRSWPEPPEIAQAQRQAIHFATSRHSTLRRSTGSTTPRFGLRRSLVSLLVARRAFWQRFSASSLGKLMGSPSGRFTRRAFGKAALAIGALPAFAAARQPSRSGWSEAPERFPQGVASGDPDSESVILWTRREPIGSEPSTMLRLELSDSADFSSVLASRTTVVTSRSDHSCRMLVGGLRPSTTYWYRFSDAAGRGSRIGRTRTAPARSDGRSVRFAFVSCQNINLGPLTAWRRMISDDARNAAAEQIEFILHLGDFVYDTVWQPEDRPNGYLDRKLRPIRYPTGERHEDYYVPVTLEDYRTLYREYLRDADLQAARARWPFVAIWDNGEFSDKGWQSLQRFGSTTVPAPTRKVAANQAWFEFQPSRARPASGLLDQFGGPQVVDKPVTRFDANGLGLEPNNLAALASLTGYRSLEWGPHVDILLTDQRSYRSDDFSSAPQAKALNGTVFPQMVPFETLQHMDSGMTSNGGSPPENLVLGDKVIPNFRKSARPRTILGSRQKAWFLSRLAKSNATWKIWANTLATFDMRADPQNLPAALARWPGAGFAGFARADYSTAYAERAEICDHVQEHRISGFVTLSGDRHSFWAGYTAKALPPEEFRPVGINFACGSISSPGMAEAFEHLLPKNHPLRALYLADGVAGERPRPVMNLLFKHGVRSCLDYAKHGDLGSAAQLSNPSNAPHVEFVDMAGHGYGLVAASEATLEVEFVCIPRPVEIEPRADGGPLRYRVLHRASRWSAGEQPSLERVVLEGDPDLSL
jgi:alkaline phosphatase D